jgi:hypothetical protein
MGVIAKETRSERRWAGFRAALVLLVLVASGSVWGDPSFDAGALRGLLEARGFSATQTQAALAMLERANARGLPASALANRIREGMARRAEPSAILGVLSDRLSYLERADDMTRRCAKEGITVRDRERSLMRLADSFSMGVTPGDIVSVLPAAARASRDLESVSGAAEVMGRLGRKGFPPGDTRDVLAAAAAAGWTRDQMDGLVAVFLEARRLGVAPEKARQILAEGILEKKEPAGLVEVMKRSSSTPPSSGPSSSGSAKGGRGAGSSRGPGSGPKSAGPHGIRPQTHPHH